MDNDLKKIWEQGSRHYKINLQQEEINKIMKRKSENIVEKIKGTIQKDQKAYPYVAAVLVALLLLFGYYGFGIYLSVVFGVLYYLNVKMIKKLYTLEIKENTLQYLLGIRSLFSYAKTYYTRLLGFGMPLIAIPVLIITLDVSGIPMDRFYSLETPKLLALLVVLVVPFSLIGIAAYRASTEAMYGKDLKRIDKIIEELSEGLEVRE